MGRRTIQQRYLARLLVRHGESVLKPAVAVTELVAAALLGLDALPADLFAAHVVAGKVARRVEVVVVVAVEVGSLGTLLALAGRDAGDANGVEAMRPRDRSDGTRGRGDGTTASAATAGCDAVGAELTSTKVRDGTGVDTAGRRVWACRGAVGVSGRRRAVRVRAHTAVGEVQSVEPTDARGRGWRH